LNFIIRTSELFCFSLVTDNKANKLRSRKWACENNSPEFSIEHRTVPSRRGSNVDLRGGKQIHRSPDRIRKQAALTTEMKLR